MTKIRMNTELRNKLFNKIKNVFENEDTQEREDFLSARESVDYHYDIAHKLAKQVGLKPGIHRQPGLIPGYYTIAR